MKRTCAIRRKSKQVTRLDLVLPNLQISFEMRLNPEIAAYLKQLIQEIIPGSTIYLFGSRADDLANGGDIDLLILTEEATNTRTLRKVRLEFIKKYGWRKIDLVNFTYSNESPFRKLIGINAIQL